MVAPLLFSASMPCTQHILSTIFSQFHADLFPFYARKGRFIFQMMSAEGQMSDRLLDLGLCLPELPGVLRGSRGRV